MLSKQQSRIGNVAFHHKPAFIGRYLAGHKPMIRKRSSVKISIIKTNVSAFHKIINHKPLYGWFGPNCLGKFPCLPRIEKKLIGIVEIRNAMNARCIIITHIFPGPFRVDHLLVEQAGIGNNTAIYVLYTGLFNRCYPFFKKILISCFRRTECWVASTADIQISIQGTVLFYPSINLKSRFETKIRSVHFQKSGCSDYFHRGSGHCCLLLIQFTDCFTCFQVTNEQTYIGIFEK